MRSLRWKLALGFALLAGLVAAGVSLVVYQITSDDLLDRGRAKAVQSARAAAAYYDHFALLTPPAVGAGDPALPAALRSAVAQGHVATFKTTVAGTPVIWAGLPARRARSGIFVRESYQADAATLATLQRTLIEVALGAAVAGALLGLVLASRLSLRLRRAAVAAERVAQGNLEARVRAGGGDEVAALGSAMNRMAASLQERIEREQRFVADVAHDLRTPLTGLMAAASLLDTDQVGTAVRERVSRLHTLVEDLLEISRLENGTATADLRRIDVDAFVRSIAERHPGVEVDAPTTVVMLTDPRRLERVIENLLLNAERHGAAPVTISVRPGRIEVSDSGPGFTEEMLTHATDRFAKGAPARGEGIGLGLAIASAQARVLDGSLMLGNRPEGGARVTVLLPAREPGE
jgi:signal transduction histidine kinase